MVSRSSQRPPGPRGTLIMGSFAALQRDLLGFVVDMQRGYGPVSHARFATQHLYSINHPELIERVLVGEAKSCVKDLSTRELMPLVGQGLLTSEGELWRRQRKLAAPPMQPKRIADYAQTMVRCAEAAFMAYGRDEARDLHADLMHLTLEIVGKTLLGFDARADADIIAHALDVFMVRFEEQFRSVMAVLPKALPTPARVRSRRAIAQLDAIIYRVIARCRTQDTEATHLLGQLVRARDEQGRPMDDVQLRDEAVTMLLAGHETTALALSYAVHLLAKHGEHAARLRAEVDAVLGRRSATLQDVPKLVFADAVVRETLRLYPPAYAIGRSVVEPFELAGYAVPAGTELMMSPYALHHDARYFPDPERFRPERWLDGSTDALPRFAYFPFGGGPRICIGNHFAMLEAVLVLATLWQHAEVVIAAGFEPQLSPIVTLRMLGGVPARVTTRAARPGAGS